MKYTPPIGGAANDPYVDANPATGVEGSPVPAAAIEHHQREIVNVITSAGLTPDVGDLTQLYQAIQRIAVGGDYKASVRATTTANIALTALQMVDGVALATGDRVLVKDQTAAAENGIYVVASGAWTRATDADDGTKLTSGATVPVESGTAQADTMWMLTTDGAITIGVTGLTFAYVAGNTGFAKTNAVNTFTKGQIGAVVALVDGATITPDFSLGNNYEVTLAGNRTLANPTNLVAGQSGVIKVAQDATGGRTLAFGSYWKFAVGSVPTLTGMASAVDLIAYHVESAARISAVFHGDMK